MPLLTETAHPRKRRAPVWLLFLAVWVLLPVAIFTWSCLEPITFEVGGTGYGFGFGERAGQRIRDQYDAADREQWPLAGGGPKFGSRGRYPNTKSFDVPFLRGKLYWIWWY
jgi:hypothetical protein